MNADLDSQQEISALREAQRGLVMCWDEGPFVEDSENISKASEPTGWLHLGKNALKVWRHAAPPADALKKQERGTFLFFLCHVSAPRRPFQN